MTVKAAAEALGVSEDTVARRRKAGTLESRQERTGSGFRWLVQLPEDTAAPALAPADAVAGTPADAPAAPADLAALTDRLERLERALVDDLAAKDKQIAEKDRQIGELHVLLQRSLEQRPTLTLPAPTEDRGASETEKPKRRGWRFWEL